MDAKREAYWWWFDSHNSPKYSPWLRSTLAELDEKAKAMLKLIEEDADSFAQRAEMYYKKRPELISMVEDFYRAYRSLAERYDQQKMDPINRVKSPLRHSVPDFKSEFGFISVDKPFTTNFIDETYNSSEDCGDHSEVDDPEEEDHHDAVVIDDGDDECGFVNQTNGFENQSNFDEMIKLREELERLREENEKQRKLIELKEKETERMKNEMESLMREKEEEKTEFEEAKHELMKEREEMQAEKTYLQNVIAEKDEEKREVIRQLSLGMEMLREENRVLKKSIMKDGHKKWGSPDFQIFKGFGNLFGLSPKCSTSVVPL